MAKDPSVESLKFIIGLYNKGKYHDSLKKAKLLQNKFPDSAILFNICGVSNHGLMKIDSAINNYNKALSIKPDYAEVYFNLGTALKDNGNLKAAVENYKKALKINPEYTQVHFNLGNSLKDINQSREAIKHYKKVLEAYPKHLNAYINLGASLINLGYLEDAIENYKIALNIYPNHPEILNNLGFAQKDHGDLDGAIKSYEMALKINPNHPEAAANLISLLCSYIPKKASENKIVKVNNKIRGIDLFYGPSSKISDNKIISIYSKSEKYLNSLPNKLSTKLSQLYRRNSVNLNCKRHMSIFNEHNVIPEFCFDCYKVQVQPRTLIELIKLFLVFDKLNLKNNNTRKCMIELRPDIPGFYKGLIYCSNISEASEIKRDLDKILNNTITSNLTSSIKRGCSEYPIFFPDFKEINFSGPQLMNFKKEWRTIEESHDKKNTIYIKDNLESISGLNLSDILIMQKWIDYAKGIGDSTATELSKNPIFYNNIFEIATKRANSINLTNL